MEITTFMIISKKIISFSLWGNKPKYIQGAIENVRLQKMYYPDWICRFYVDSTVASDIIGKLHDAEICYMPDSDGNFGLFWRFLPLDDLTVDRFIVRDTDSRLNVREAAAVREWEVSGKCFHIMRDHQGHISVPICGAMWGATSDFRPGYIYLVNKWLFENSHIYSMHDRGKFFYTDQVFLTECIWPLIADKHLAHESIVSEYKGEKRNFTLTNADGMFVGKQIEV
jgi:hypothetical protein